MFDILGTFVRGESRNAESGEDERIEYRRSVLVKRTSAAKSHRREYAPRRLSLVLIILHNFS